MRLTIPDEAEYKAFTTDKLFVARVGSWQAAANSLRDRRRFVSLNALRSTASVPFSCIGLTMATAGDLASVWKIWHRICIGKRKKAKRTPRSFLRCVPFSFITYFAL
jgi:hypothetical protein